MTLTRADLERALAIEEAIKPHYNYVNATSDRIEALERAIEDYDAAYMPTSTADVRRALNLDDDD